jgi:hypothetical protein
MMQRLKLVLEKETAPCAWKHVGWNHQFSDTHLTPLNGIPSPRVPRWSKMYLAQIFWEPLISIDFWSLSISLAGSQQNLPGTISRVWKLWFLLLRVTWETRWMARSCGPKEMIFKLDVLGSDQRGTSSSVWVLQFRSRCSEFWIQQFPWPAFVADANPFFQSVRGPIHPRWWVCLKIGYSIRWIVTVPSEKAISYPGVKIIPQKEHVSS